MTIGAATDVESLDADVVRVRTSVAPPFGRAENTDNRRFCGNRQMCRRGVAADVNFCPFCQFIKTFQARLREQNTIGFRVLQNLLRQLRFIRRGRNDGNQIIFFPQTVSQRSEFFRVPELCRPAARRI